LEESFKRFTVDDRTTK